MVPGSTFVSTDSHANILGAVGAFGQGMGDVDIAHAFAAGRVWFKAPPTVKVLLRGAPAAATTAKDIVLAALREFGAAGLLGCAAEIYGPAVDELDVSGRITVASMATEMGGIIAVLLVTIHFFGMVGTTAAAIAFMIGRVGGNLFLIPPCLMLQRSDASQNGTLSSQNDI